MRRGGGRWAPVLWTVGMVVLGCGPGARLGAQAVPPPTQTGVEEGAPSALQEAVGDDEQLPVSPAGAFARSALIPGWGHVATGSFARGGFYVTAQSGSLWMLWKSSQRRREANALLRVERRVVESRLGFEGVTDPEALLLAVEADPGVQYWTDLVEVRGQQVEDWVAVSVFLVLLGAADAFVAAHLMDFPERLSLEVLPRWDTRGVEVGLRLPLPIGQRSSHLRSSGEAPSVITR